MKVLIVILTPKMGYMMFSYDSEFIVALSKEKKDLGLRWNSLQRRWDFETKNVDKIKDFLNCNDVEFLIDDKLKQSKEKMIQTNC